MSADDGIYILTTKGTEQKPLEYRVAWAQAIENLLDPDTGFSSWYAIDIFGKSNVHSSLNEALEEAVGLLRDLQLEDSVVEDGELVYVWVPEYGIQVEDFSDYPFPNGEG
ncbi:hypothetical protein H6796_01105 [Candidatus Nomurabacteria bacterium]|nr:hypothetical protein [Candidatus Nomurabacteria bacterium]